MKKLTQIMVVVALMISTNLFAQENTSVKVESIAKEILKAYKTKDVELLKKHASGVLQDAISESYFEDADSKEYTEVAKRWDGRIKGIGYDVQAMGAMTMYMANVYFADAEKEGEIYEVVLSKLNDQDWVMFARGILKAQKSEFDELSKSLAVNKPNEATVNYRNISIEMANGDTFKNASFDKAISNFKKMDDDNFFMILNLDDGESFMQFAYSKKGYTVEYKENGVQYEAKKLIDKKTAELLIKEYYTSDESWKTEVKWEKM